MGGPTSFGTLFLLILSLGLGVSTSKRRVLDGENQVSLPCPFQPSSQVRWTLNGIQVENTTRRYQIGTDLFISRVKKDEDEGEYSCIGISGTITGQLNTGSISVNVIWMGSFASVHLASSQVPSDIRPGVDVVLKCKVDMSEGLDVEYEWFRNGDPIQPSETLSIRAKRLHIRSVFPERDNGCYTCRARNEFAGIASSGEKFPLIIKDEKVPHILLVPQDLVVKKSSQAIFDCIFESNTDIQWYFYDGEQLQNSSRHILHPNGSLTINNVQGADEGIYKCLGTSPSHPEQEPQIYSVSLKVSYLEQLSPTHSFNPSPPFSPNMFPVPTKGDVEISCERPEGLPVPQVWWEGQDGRIMTSTTSGDEEEDSNSVLRLKNVGIKETGNYTCVASNLEGETRARIQLVVVDPPSVYGHPLSIIAAEGDPAVFQCQFHGPEYPISQIHWKKDGHILPPEQGIITTPENATLRIQQVQKSDAGEYLCIVDTYGHKPVESRKGELFVTESLKFIPKPTDRKLELGSSSKLHCRANGNPRPVIKWVKEGQPLFHWPSHISDANGTLSFSQVQSNDKGRYTCVATNKQGIINTTIQVDVVVSPKFSLRPQNPTEASEGESVMMNCQAHGDPTPTIQWDKDNDILTPLFSKRFRIFDNGSLSIGPILKEDEARYGCTAGNSGGFKREEIKLIVKSSIHFFSLSESGNDGTNTEAVMTRTVSITLSVAGVYMVLVVGLMMWCRLRQIRRKQAYLEEIRKETGDVEMTQKEPCHLTIPCNGNGTISVPIPVLVPNGNGLTPLPNGSCRESVKSDKSSSHSGNTKSASASVTASITSHRSNASSKRSNASGLDKISFYRENLQFVMLLGHGEFGEVFLAKSSTPISERTTETLVMIKSLQARNENALFEYKMEIDMYYKLCHENVAKLIGICREMDPHYMVMEYSDWGDLKQFLLATRPDSRGPIRVPKPPALTVPQILQVITQVAFGMEHLSNHRFIHKDLATRNCLISSGLKIKVANPSLCKDTYASEYFRYRNQLIPIRWLPPESILEDDYSTKSDVWSFGVLIWEVLTQASIPWSQLSNDQLISSIQRKELRWRTDELDNKLPPGLKKLLSQCWDLSPRNRNTFSTLVIQLSEIMKEDLNIG